MQPHFPCIPFLCRTPERKKMHCTLAGTVRLFRISLHGTIITQMLYIVKLFTNKEHGSLPDRSRRINISFLSCFLEEYML